MIPRIVHQTAANRDLSVQLKLLQKNIQCTLPGWTCQFYDDDQCRELVEIAFPDCLPFYDGLDTGVQRSDLFRWAAVFVHGGFYMDCDIKLHNDLTELCTHSLVFAEEKTLTRHEAERLGHQHTMRIANYMFGASRQHPWVAGLIKNMSQKNVAVTSEFDVLESTGPGFVTRYLHENYPREDWHLLKHPGVCCERCGGQSCQFGDYASHLHFGTWRWQ